MLAGMRLGRCLPEHHFK